MRRGLLLLLLGFFFLLLTMVFLRIPLFAPHDGILFSARQVVLPLIEIVGNDKAKASIQLPVRGSWRGEGRQENWRELQQQPASSLPSIFCTYKSPPSILSTYKSYQNTSNIFRSPPSIKSFSYIQIPTRTDQAFALSSKSFFYIQILPEHGKYLSYPPSPSLHPAADRSLGRTSSEQGEKDEAKVCY